MALPPLASIADLEEWLGIEPLDEDSADAARAGAYLRVASALVRSFTHREWVGEDDEADASEPAITDEDIELVKGIVVQAAERKWRNPTGAVQETRGPFSSTYAAAVAFGIFLTEVEEAQLLDFQVAPARPKLWSLRTTRGDCLDTNWVDVYPPGQPLPVDYP